MKNLLITGAISDIGRELLLSIKKDDFENIVVMDADPLIIIDKKITPIQCDYFDEEEIIKAFESIKNIELTHIVNCDENELIEKHAAKNVGNGTTINAFEVLKNEFVTPSQVAIEILSMIK